MDVITSTDQAIHKYMEQAWSIIPIRTRDKRPLVSWEEFQDRRPDERIVRAWFRSWPDAGIGIVTGAVSGLVVLDIDVQHGGDLTVEQLEEEHGRMPITMECRTGGGGRHLYFAHPGGRIRNRVGLVPGVDVRGDGGYVVAPPSAHVSGARYTWVEGRAPGDAVIADLPAWILPQLTQQRVRHGHPIAYWRRLIADGVPVGTRNTTIASLAGHLLRQGVDTAVVMELLLCWNHVRCRPPLSADEVVAVVASISRIHVRGEGLRTHQG